MSRRALSRALSLGALALAATASAGWTQTGDAAAGFTGTGPAGFKLEGKTKAVTVKDDGKALTVVVGLKDLETGIALRDKHMREKYIEVDKHPEATLAVPLDALKVPEDGASLEAEAKGTFTVHGVSKELAFKYKASCKGGTCDVEGTAQANFKDHGVNVPSYMGITVKPGITVRARFQVKKG